MKLSQVREDLGHEALQFIKEQRIRCLLDGAWFPCMGYGDSGLVTKQNLNRTATGNWRFIRLSHNRRYLHWGDFESKMDPSPGLDDLKEQSTAINPCWITS
jgi:engulfment and cell motility protein 1